MPAFLENRVTVLWLDSTFCGCQATTIAAAGGTPGGGGCGGPTFSNPSRRDHTKIQSDRLERRVPTDEGRGTSSVIYQVTFGEPVALVPLTLDCAGHAL